MKQGKDPLMRFFSKTRYTIGEFARLRQIVRPSGHTMILPYDQFIEHDNRHIEAESDAGNPHYICELAEEGGYNAVAIHYGLAKRYWTTLMGRIPLLLKINGKTSIPSGEPLSVLTGSVEDAVRMGAVAVGYTMYYGSPRQDEDILQLAKVRQECDRYGMPLVVWAYPRGSAVDAKGGKDSSYMVESAARMATEMGASVIKINLPKAAKPDFFDNAGVPEYYRKLEKDLQAMPLKEQQSERAKRAVAAAQGVPVLFSGGEQIKDDDLIANTQACIDAGCFGFIFGRNMWKRKKEDALKLTKMFQEMIDKS